MVNIVFAIGIMLLLAVGVSAADNGHRVFTQAELQGQVPLNNEISTEEQDFDRFGGLDGFEKIYEIEGVAAGQSVDYYLPFKNGFFLLTSPTNSTLSRTMFPAGNNNAHMYQKWRFTPDSNGNYVVYSYAYPTKCLTINPGTRGVYLAEYTGSQFQKWGMYYNNSTGNALMSEAISHTNGFKLTVSGTTFSVSGSTYSPICFFDADSFVPTESVTIETVYIGENRHVTVVPNITPSNATIKPNTGLSGWSYNTMHGLFTVSDFGLVTGINNGNNYISYTDPMTKVSNTSTVYVLENVVNLDVLFDKGYEYRYYLEEDRIEYAMNILQRKYASEFGIYVDWDNPSGFTSIADRCPGNDTDGDGEYTILDTGGYNVRCTCGGSSCVTHHKSIYNILNDIDNPNLSETLRIAFIGHDTCDKVNENHTVNNKAIGLSNTLLGKYAIFTLADDEETVDYNNRRIMTAVHEFGHLYGADDHTVPLEVYRENFPTEYERYVALGYSDNCIYGANKDDPDIYNNLVFCDMCKAKVEDNIDCYDHR